ncbi:MAG: thymidylate synthase [Propionibacteriaceae bacterium]|nr:thymidylate synthase [Propionibacteriaceae bacterium]
MEFSNINTALLGLLSTISTQGRDLTTRGSATKEIGPIQFTLTNPGQRCLILPGRGNNIFASIAETMWVLAGRNDVEFLRHYLPRAGDFSDDGSTWRAGYGPRLRNWHSVDQLDEVRKILTAEPTSRRAVATIYDPAQDFTVSKDIPCNNWLHFTCRDGALNAHIAIRSNDVIWGLSGINAFEWSVLLEMMAYWLNVEVGQLTFSITSEHLYEQHFERAATILQTPVSFDPYNRQVLETLHFATPWEQTQERIEAWFDLEEKVRTGVPCAEEIHDFPDPLLRGFLFMVQVYWAIKTKKDVSEITALMEPLQGTDLGEAATEYASRQVKGFPEYDYHTSLQRGDLPEGLYDTISLLHQVKSLAYGDSWKRRGERIGIMANLARKVDRLENVDLASTDVDETGLDTAIDLLVYGVKYFTYLVDQGEASAPPTVDPTPSPMSDGIAGFNALLSEVLSEPTPGSPLDTGVQAIKSAYQKLEDIVEQRDTTEGKTTALTDLITESVGLVSTLTQVAPQAYQQFMAKVGKDAASTTESEER